MEWNITHSYAYSWSALRSSGENSRLQSAISPLDVAQLYLPQPKQRESQISMNPLFFFKALTGHTYYACIMSKSVSRNYSSMFHVADFFKGHIVSSKCKLYSLYATQEK